MNPIFKNILAVSAGLLIGGLTNMGIVMMSGSIIPPPAGADVTTMEGLQKSLHLFQPRHFIMPFTAHAVGTLVGALITAWIAVNKKLFLALLIGLFFLIGGIEAVKMLPAPMWFNIVDLTAAYIPMALIGFMISKKIQGKSE